MCLAISSPTVGTLPKTHNIALISGLDTPTSNTSILDGIKTQSSVLTRNRRKETLFKLQYIHVHVAEGPWVRTRTVNTRKKKNTSLACLWV